ncbi:MAG: DUF2800 domain-containing protein [Gammaproteobacteria bacterium]|nr:DUF2800 domain-containing protein [Gammaproteobacteria bacterium]
MSNHSNVPPSGLSRVLKCSASLMANARDGTSNEAAMEGSTAHWANDQRLKGHAVNVGDICPETNLPVNQDMLTYGDLYLNYVKTLGGEVGSEVRVSVPQIHKDCWGTLDYYAYYQTLTIVDYKYGYIAINPVDSMQLMAYARGKANDLKLGPNCSVDLVIVQPRPWNPAGRIRTFHTTVGSIDKHIAKLKIAVEEGLSQNKMARTGDHCMYCVKAPTCEALLSASYNAIDIARRDYDVVDFGNAQLALCLENLERAEGLIKIRKDALKEKAENAISAGSSVPGYELTPRWSGKQWTRPSDEVKMMGKLLGVDLTKESLLTPTQAKAKGISTDILEKLSKSVQTGVKLTKNNVNLARLIFSKKVD